MKTADEIVRLFDEMRGQSRFAKERMEQIREQVDGDVAIPLPELSATEAPAVANYTYRGLQSMSQRLASVQPRTQFAPLAHGKAAADRAETRMRVADFWDAKDFSPLLDAQVARYMFGYGTSPEMIWLHPTEDRPVRRLPSPLTVYVPEPAQVNEICPPYAIAARQITKARLLVMMPEPAVITRLKDARPQDVFWVLEYNDAIETHTVLGGKVHTTHGHLLHNTDPQGGLTLRRIQNRTEMCLWVAPGLVNLAKPMGHFDHLVGMYQAAGLLEALSLQQAARSVFPEQWLVARQGELPEIVTKAEPLEGTVGVVRGGDLVTETPPPAFNTSMMIDRLGEAQRTTAAVPADFGGQAASNVRTGRRADQLISAAVDPALGEAQTIVALARQEMMRRKIALDKAYLNKPKTIHVTWRGRAASNTYTPDELWETDECLVSYPVTGTDTNSLAILLGQLMGLNLISAETARDKLPMIGDADGEKSLIMGEQLERTFLESLLAQVQDPASPMQPRMIARLIKLIKEEDMSPVDAFEKVQAEAQEEQAKAQEEQPPAPGPEGIDPSMMPGLDGPAPAVQGPGQGTQNLSSLMRNLRMPERQVATSAGGRA